MSMRAVIVLILLGVKGSPLWNSLHDSSAVMQAEVTQMYSDACNPVPG